MGSVGNDPIRRITTANYADCFQQHRPRWRIGVIWDGDEGAEYSAEEVIGDHGATTHSESQRLPTPPRLRYKFLVVTPSIDTSLSLLVWPRDGVRSKGCIVLLVEIDSNRNTSA